VNQNHVDINHLQQQIQNNCDISDAKYGGVYSLCGLLLRLRDLYKWQVGLQPWLEPEPADLLEWVDAREQQWEKISQEDFQFLIIGDESFQPFEASAINTILRPLGYIYGAGYGAAMKPSFFLGELVDSRRTGELRIDMVNRELARDLFVSPAMRQGDQILARRSAMLFSLWDQILEMRPSVREALIYALSQHNLDARKLRSFPKELGPALHRVAEVELESWIHHEIGEVREDVFDGYLWHEIVSTHSNSPIEIFTRVIKDLLADTHEQGLLAHVIEMRKKSSLGFYIAFMRPFSKLMFPEAGEAFRQFQGHSNWKVIDEARRKGYAKAHRNALALVELHLEGRKRGADWARSRILTELIEPLGVLNALAEDDAGEQ